jgi:hypothetical protein
MNEEEKKLLPAGFFAPVAAIIIDLIILLTGFFALIEILLLFNLEVVILKSLLYPFIILLALTFLGYFTYYISQYGQTPGYKFMKIKMVTAGGKNLTARQALSKFASQIFAGDNVVSTNYGYGDASDNYDNITIIKTGESKWQTIITCGCIFPISFILVVYLFIKVSEQFSDRRETGIYQGIRK